MHFSFVILRMISKRNWPIHHLGKRTICLHSTLFHAMICREISKVVAHMWENIEPEVKEVSSHLLFIALLISLPDF